ncbi:hypothetical protein ETW23_19925 [Leisingera sp. NJS201]|uniref:hypothetical protein n=1 Tax=Leisingera sp. NJS201 TaxID=2508306 RepID=UPI001071275E|nr:hypothetical protein [Leisingera sp. NJS201]QBR38029.1 hypothetical protein ETW23_19925 [Leisingera sp. NJS201]
MISIDRHDSPVEKLNGDMSDLFWLTDAQMAGWHTTTGFWPLKTVRRENDPADRFLIPPSAMSRNL